MPTNFCDKQSGPVLNGASLDPPDWNNARQVAHHMLDIAFDYLEKVRDRPVWQPVPEEVKGALRESVPREACGLDQVCADFLEDVMPFATGNTHPRFFGWVHGTGTVSGVVAEMMAAALNANLGGRDHAPIYVERQVLSWFQTLFGLPAESGGIMLSGTSMAHVVGLAVARQWAVGREVRTNGLSSVGRLVGYTSTEAHSSVAGAFELLGLGRNFLRSVPVDDNFRMNIAALREMIKSDRADGHRPFCVIPTIGTVNTGAIDDLNAVADICNDNGLWMHVDGAFGALVRLSSPLAHLTSGIERCHSLAFDFHKWLHVPYDAGCLLVREGAHQLAAFSNRPDYLVPRKRGLAGGEPWFCELGPELSRGFRALKVWFTLKEHGIIRIGQKISDNCAQAAWLGCRISEEPVLQLLAPVSLNIVCFRYTAAPPESLDALNDEIVTDLQERGIAAPSTTRIHGKLAIRVNITNHRTQQDDLELLVRSVLETGHRLRSLAG